MIQVGRGNAALAAAVALPRSGKPNVPQGVKIRRGRRREEREKESTPAHLKRRYTSSNDYALFTLCWVRV